MSTVPSPATPLPSTVSVAPEVVDELGGYAEASALLASGATGTYRCVVCGETDRFTTGHPASVLACAYNGGAGPRAIRYAHPRCCPSKTTIIGGPAWEQGMQRRLAAPWLRPTGHDPRAMLLFGPRFTPVEPPEITPSGEAVDRLTCVLLDAGFTLVTGLDQPLPLLPGAAAGILSPMLMIHDRHGEPLYAGAPLMPWRWRRAARATGRLGLVLCCGEYGLPDYDRDSITDLTTAIAEGRALGATVTLHTGR